MRDKSVSKTRLAAWLRQNNKIQKIQKKDKKKLKQKIKTKVKVKMMKNLYA